MQKLKINEFIHEHFAEDEAHDIENALEAMNLTNIYNNSVAILQDESMPKDEIVIANLATGLLTSVTYKTGKIEDQGQKHFTLTYFARLTERLLILLVSENLEDSAQIFRSLEKSLRISCVQFGYDYKVLRQFFDFEKIKLIVDSLKLKTQDGTKEIKSIKKQRYTWLEKGNLNELTDILVKDNYIKSKKEFYDLFLKPKEDSTVRWNAEKKFHLAYLLNRLFADGFAKIEANKGYFSYAEKHFVTYEQEFFSTNTLKKISSQITIYPEDYLPVIRDVDDILERIRIK